MDTLQRWTAWAGGPIALTAILLFQLALVVLLVLDSTLSVVAVLSLGVVFMVMDRPIVGVGLLILSRLITTGATVFFSVGKFGIGPFELMLVLCFGTLALHAVVRRDFAWHGWPWQIPFTGFIVWMIFSLLWSAAPVEGLGEILPLLLVLGNTTVIVRFVRTIDDFRLMLWFWLGACVLIGLSAVVTSVLDLSVGRVFEAAVKGGRETGLGQQPNWFAMNLIFIIHTAFGMAILERRWLRRWLIMLAGFFVFFMMLKSGSRGATIATIMGGVLTALFHPGFRKWFIRICLGSFTLIAFGLQWNMGNSSRALERIGSAAVLAQEYRPNNWRVCVEMFQNTFGRGIGAGGYTTLLPDYNYRLSQSLYDYPHGVPWELMAHHGVIGILLFIALLSILGVMGYRLLNWTRGSDLEVFAWTMPASMLGYATWCTVEFTIAEKPVWEFVALYTAFYLIVKRIHEEGGSMNFYSEEDSALPQVEELDAVTELDPAQPL